MMQKISSDTLRAFVDAILSLVTDQRLRGLNDQIFRSLNIVVIRLCDSTNPNSCFVALMKLIIKYQAQQPDGKMMDCVRKCMIKHTEILADPNKVEQVFHNIIILFFIIFRLIFPPCLSQSTPIIRASMLSTTNRNMMSPSSKHPKCFTSTCNE